jgi:hypothetical protein
MARCDRTNHTIPESSRAHARSRQLLDPRAQLLPYLARRPALRSIDRAECDTLGPLCAGIACVHVDQPELDQIVVQCCCDRLVHCLHAGLAAQCDGEIDALDMPARAPVRLGRDGRWQQEFDSLGRLGGRYAIGAVVERAGVSQRAPLCVELEAVYDDASATGWLPCNL